MEANTEILPERELGSGRGIGGLLARSHGYSGGSWSSHNYYHADGNGNVTALVDSLGALQAGYRYDPYGRLLDQTGPLADANLLRWTSKPWVAFGGSPVNGLYYFGYRFYEPYLQRWLNRDPLEEKGSANPYGFAKNDPQNYIDAFGKFPFLPGKPWPWRFPVKPPQGYFAGPWTVVGVTVEYSLGKCVEKICEYARIVGRYDEIGKTETTSQTVGCCERCPLLGPDSQPIGSYADPFPIKPIEQLPRNPWEPLNPRDKRYQ